MRLVITEDGAGAAQWVAALVKRRITEFAPTAERPFVLGLPTGSSPIATYKVCPFRRRFLFRSFSFSFILSFSRRHTNTRTRQILVEYVKKGELSFKHVVTFNMDEYVGTSCLPFSSLLFFSFLFLTSSTRWCHARSVARPPRVLLGVHAPSPVRSH